MAGRAVPSRLTAYFAGECKINSSSRNSDLRTPATSARDEIDAPETTTTSLPRIRGSLRVLPMNWRQKPIVAHFAAVFFQVGHDLHPRDFPFGGKFYGVGDRHVLA